jgi:hypothetical protein
MLSRNHKFIAQITDTYLPFARALTTNLFDPKAGHIYSLKNAYTDIDKIKRLAHIIPSPIPKVDGDYRPSKEQRNIMVKEIARVIKMAAICRAYYDWGEDKLERSIELAEKGFDRPCTHQSTEPDSYSPHWYERAEAIYKANKQAYCEEHNKWRVFIEEEKSKDGPKLP